MNRSRLSSWQGKVALITGGSSGIGLATARLLAASGAHVFLVARRMEVLKTALSEVEAARANPTQLFDIFSADVSQADEAAAAVEYVSGSAAVPDLIVNSAGVVHPGYIKDLDLEKFHWMMDTNYFGLVNIAKAAIPGMISRASGNIVNVSSGAGFLGVIGYSAYAGSKFAVDGFSESLRAELRLYGIKVSLLFPPDTDTPQLAYENQFKPPEIRALAKTMKPLSAESVARKMLEGAARGKFLIFPSSDVKLMYLASRYLGSATYSIVDIITDRARRNGAGRA